MRQAKVSAAVVGVALVGLLGSVAIADSGAGHGPPPGKGPKATPSAKATPPVDGSGHRNPGDQGKGACVSACQRANRDCTKTANSNRKDCYTATCAQQRATVEACNGTGDGVTDQGAGCAAAAAALRQCLQDCRTSSTAARQSCTQSVLACLATCSLPRPTPTATPTATETPGA